MATVRKLNTNYTYTDILIDTNYYYEYILKITDQLLTLNDICLRNIFPVLLEEIKERKDVIENKIREGGLSMVAPGELQDLTDAESWVKEIGKIIEKDTHILNKYKMIEEGAYEIGFLKSKLVGTLKWQEMKENGL